LEKTWSDFRDRIEQIVQSKFFEWFILFIITISSICLVSCVTSSMKLYWKLYQFQQLHIVGTECPEMKYTCIKSCYYVILQAFEDIHLRNDKDLQNILHCLDIAFVVIFSLEFLLKLVGLGFVRYFSNGWNYLDLGIVIVSDRMS
jgi:hypothetical protein